MCRAQRSLAQDFTGKGGLRHRSCFPPAAAALPLMDCYLRSFQSLHSTPFQTLSSSSHQRAARVPSTASVFQAAPRPTSLCCPFHSQTVTTKWFSPDVSAWPRDPQILPAPTSLRHACILPRVSRRSGPRLGHCSRVADSAMAPNLSLNRCRVCLVHSSPALGPHPLSVTNKSIATRRIFCSGQWTRDGLQTK